MKMIYPELIKNRFISLSIMLMITASAAVSGIAIGCSKLEKNMDKVEKGLTYVTLCQIFLLFLVPMGIMLLNMLFTSREESCGGWRIVMTSGISSGSVHFAKIILIFAAVLIMFIPLTIGGIYFIRDLAPGPVTETVLHPLASAYICFLPMCVLMYFAAILLNCTLPVIFSGLLFIISTIFISSSDMEKYDPLCYPYILSMNNDNVLYRIAAAIGVSVLLYAAGTLIARKRIAAYI